MEDERLRFVARLLDGEKMAALCREFSISRKTGYKIFNRYKETGLEGLTDRSRRPYRHANQLPFQIESLIVQIQAGLSGLGRTEDPRALAPPLPRRPHARGLDGACCPRPQRPDAQAGAVRLGLPTPNEKPPLAARRAAKSRCLVNRRKNIEPAAGLFRAVLRIGSERKVCN